MATDASTRQAAYPERGVLYMAIELSASKWRLAMSAGGEKVRDASVQPNDAEGLLAVIAKAKARLGLPESAEVRSCYEAGRDGFWVDRFLTGLGIRNLVLDASSLKVDRRKRRAKSDRLDARSMLRDLVRYWAGDTDVWRVVRVPTAEQEDNRRLHRERERLKKERTQHRARIRSLCATQGVTISRLSTLLEDLEAVTIWDGSPLPPELKAEIGREGERLARVEQQLLELAQLQRERLEQLWSSSDELGKVRALMLLRGLGLDSAWLLVMELFWRKFQNRRQVAGAVGLGGTPYSSGATEREQGISKAGNPRVRARMIQLAWLWVRYQPNSPLTKWFEARFAGGGSRHRRVGIVAVARRLLIELWHFAEHGVVPRGAVIEI